MCSSDLVLPCYVFGSLRWPHALLCYQVIVQASKICDFGIDVYARGNHGLQQHLEQMGGLESTVAPLIDDVLAAMHKAEKRRAAAFPELFNSTLSLTQLARRYRFDHLWPCTKAELIALGIDDADGGGRARREQGQQSQPARDAQARAVSIETAPAAAERDGRQGVGQDYEIGRAHV